VKLSRAAAAGLLCLALAGCGSTVQVTSTAAVPDGLSTDLGGVPSGAQTPGSALPVPSEAPAPTGPGSFGGAPVAVVPGGTPATTGTGPVQPGGTQSAWVRTPISVGLMDVGDVSATASSLGFKTSNGATPQQLMRALVSWYNLHGGIAGRKIKPVEYTADASSNSYDSQGQAACASFTQDNHVAVALSQTEFELSPVYEACLTQAGVPDINGSLAGLDSGELARNPGLFMTSAASVDRSILAEVRGLTANGFLTPKNVIGVLVEACTYNIDAYNRTFVPLAKQLHLTLLRRDFACVDSNSSIANAVAQVDAAVLPFQSSRVDRVTFVSNNQGAATVFFENQAASQGYKPSYALTSFSTAGPGASQISADAQTRIQGVGWTPYADLGSLPAPGAAAKRCRAALAEMQVPYNAGDDLLMYGVCGQFFALEDALKATHGRSDRASLVAALETRSASPFLLGGERVASRARHDAPALFAPWGRAAACGCFSYTGKPEALAGP
jgi:hypothetical protein